MPSRAGSPTLRRRLGARIRALREEAGITQEKLAWACEIPKPHLSRIEGGDRLPSLPVIFTLAKELHVEPMDLIAFDARKPRVRLLDAARRGDRVQVREALKRLGLA